MNANTQDCARAKGSHLTMIRKNKLGYCKGKYTENFENSKPVGSEPEAGGLQR